MTKAVRTSKPPPAVASHDDVVRVFGPLEDEAVAEILALGPTIAELEEAQAWLVGQGNGLARSGHPQTAKIAAILDIVADEDEEEDHPSQR